MLQEQQQVVVVLGQLHRLQVHQLHTLVVEAEEQMLVQTALVVLGVVVLAEAEEMVQQILAAVAVEVILLMLQVMAVQA
jgi:hypothetical protein